MGNLDATSASTAPRLDASGKHRFPSEHREPQNLLLVGLEAVATEAVGPTVSTADRGGEQNRNVDGRMGDLELCLCLSQAEELEIEAEVETMLQPPHGAKGTPSSTTEQAPPLSRKFYPVDWPSSPTSPVSTNPAGNSRGSEWRRWSEPVSEINSEDNSEATSNNVLQWHDGFGHAVSVNPVGLQNMGKTCFMAALIQVLVRADGFVRSCALGSEFGCHILEIIKSMRESDSSAVFPANLTAWLRAQPEFLQTCWQSSGEGDPQALYLHFFRNLIQSDVEGGGQIVTDFGVAEQYVITCKGCKAEVTTPNQIKPLLQLVKISRPLQKSVNKLFSTIRKRQYCTRCESATTQSITRTPFPPPTHLSMFLNKDTCSKLQVRIGDTLRLPQRGRPMYVITGTVEALPAHFAANFQEGGLSFRANDEKVAPNGAPHAAYIIVCKRIPEAHDIQLALQMPCVKCDVSGCNNHGPNRRSECKCCYCRGQCY